MDNPIKLIAVGTFTQVETLTRLLRQACHVNHELDRARRQPQSDPQPDRRITRLLTLDLNGQPADEARLRAELVDAAHESAKSRYEAEVEHYKCQAEYWRQQHADLLAEINQIIREAK